jgi:signal transduction histidine kinase
MKLRMRTKFLLSMLLISASLTSTSLLLVRHSIQGQVRKEIFADLQNSVLTFRNFQRERELTLTHAADLLADLPNLRALMTTQHEATIQDASRDLWRLAGSDLFLLADRTGRVVALHTSSQGLSRDTAQQSFINTLSEDSPEHWWLGREQLYEVFRRPIYFGPQAQNRLLGYLVIGYEIDEKVAAQVSRIAASQVAFYYEDRVVRSTLAPAQKSELSDAVGVLKKGSSEPEEIQLGNERYLLRSVQLAASRTAPRVQLSVFKSYDEATGFLKRLNRLLLALGLVAVLGGSALVFVISDTFTRPLGSLVHGVRALEKGDYTYALDVRSGDEVAELTGAFQRMRDSLLKTQQELLEAERLATIGRMASSISHDLRHALAAIVANAEFLCESRLSSEQREELYQEVRVAVNQMTDLLDSLLEFSRTRESLRPAYCDLRTSIDHVVQTIRSHPEFQPISIEIRQKGDVSGWFDSKKLERAFYNLLLNACEAVIPGGRIEIMLHSIPGAVEIRFADNGRGVPAAVRGKLFEPFISYGKENGTGLGLTVVQKIVQDHRGEINIENTSTHGTTFRMLLPTGCSPKSQAALQESVAELPSFTQPEKARSE